MYIFLKVRKHGFIVTNSVQFSFEFLFANENANLKWINQLICENFARTVTFATTKLIF